MKKFMSLLLASCFLAAASVYAIDEPLLIGDVEYMSPEVDPGYGQVIAESCPRGWDRVPQYRWNHRRHKWEFSGWTCRRQRSTQPPQ